jgi:methylenetetrahydrofolate dehydrogenase (NADP+)/methenyltetrahydrofolate cyclohydrolase
MANVINGKEIAAVIRGELAQQVKVLKEERGIVPGLAVIIVGEDPASKVYVRNKHRACEEVGFASFGYELPATTSEEELLALIGKLNRDDSVHGILVQLPLPRHLDEEKILLSIDPAKDVDAFHPYNVGKIMIGNYDFLPCTPAGVMELLRRSEIEISGKECVVVGRSNIVGKPQAMLLLQANGTVTICHSRTKDLRETCRRADILIAAIGKPEFFDSSYVKEGAVVIDVGINRRADGTLCGDVNYADVAPHTSYITPVPGGVGPMTIAMLMQNTLTAAMK